MSRQVVEMDGNSMFLFVRQQDFFFTIPSFHPSQVVGGSARRTFNWQVAKRDACRTDTQIDFIFWFFSLGTVGWSLQERQPLKSHHHRHHQLHPASPNSALLLIL